MKHIILFSIFLFSIYILRAQSYNIGDKEIVETCNATFYDAGGTQGFAGNDHLITTFHADSNCLQVTFEIFDLGFGGELKIYKGNGAVPGTLFGTYAGTNIPPVIVGEYITFEYIPPVFNAGNLPGWKANIRCGDCSSGGMIMSDPASDCVGAIPLCANSTVIVSTNQYTDTGSETDEVGSCLSGTGTGGSVWYTFQPQNSGDLDFSIAPSGGTDYDFVLYDATNGCDDLDELSCNYSADYGTTGCTTNSSDYSNSYSSCTGSSYYSAPADCGVWNEPAGVTFGHTYVLFVNFYSGSNAGFTLHFQNDPGTVAITDNIPPTFSTASQLSCNGNSLHVDFSENIDCNTLEASDFAIPGYTIVINNSGCSNGMTYDVDLTITPPLAPGSYTLTGQTMNDMCGNPLNDGQTITVASAPVFNVGTTCDPTGTIATLTATGCSGTLTWNKWDTVCTTTCLGVIVFGNCVGTWVTNCDSAWDPIGTGPTINVNAPYATLYMASCVAPSGCETQNAFIIDCNPTLSATVNSESICSGGCADISATVNGGIAPLTYVWDPPTLTGQGPNNVCPTVTTDYTVTITDGGGNTVSAMGTVTVGTSLSPSISGATSFCTGYSTSLDAGAGYASYLWSTTEATQTITVSAGGTYSVTVSDGSGCSGSTSVTVTESSSLTPTITGPTAICAGSTATLDAGNGYTSYLWSTTDATQTITVNTGGTYSVTVSDASGCSGTVSASLTVGSSLSVSVTPATSSICTGQSVTLTATGAATYSWSPATGLSSTTGDVVIASPVAATTYTVTGSDALGCTGSTSVTVSVGQLNVITNSTSENCGQGDGSATAIATGGNGNYTYLWGGGQTTQTITGLSAGSYSVTVNDGSCSGEAIAVVSNIPGPTAGFSANPSVGTLYNPITFLSNSSGNIVSWNWSFGDGANSGSGTEVIHQYTSLGAYLVTLIVTDMNGCTDTVTDSLMVREIFTLYIPNSFTPDGDGLNDGFSPQGLNVDPESFEMYIFDRWGKMFYHTTKWNVISGEPWNGTLNNKGGYDDIVVGVYVYRIVLKELDGPKHEYLGGVSIIQ